MNRDTLLMVADSEHDANMLYAVKVFIADPFIYLRINGRCQLVLNDPEVERARKWVRGCQVIPLGACLQKLRRAGSKTTSLAGVIRLILRENRLRRVVVPSNFPFGLARELRQLKIKVKPQRGAFFAEREIKSSVEIKKISAALTMAEVGLAEGIQALKCAKSTKNGRLLYHNLPLTSEKLRSIIDTAILQAGGIASHTIVAGGVQTCDPHECGSGPLRANQPIILNVSPRSQKTGYFGDIARTVVKGRASEALRKMYHAVTQAQEFAVAQFRQNNTGKEIHEGVQEVFEREGYKTSRRNGHMHGFFHGTGHGLGLELRETPRLGSASDDVLKAGHVVTAEPGLYYPEIGGVRLEDVVQVTRKAPRNLTKFEKVLEV